MACLGLLKAIDRYDPALGPFVSYAVPNFMGELERHFRDKVWLCAFRARCSAQAGPG